MQRRMEREMRRRLGGSSKAEERDGEIRSEAGKTGLMKDGERDGK
jgi:hypothetical protein